MENYSKKNKKEKTTIQKILEEYELKQKKTPFIIKRKMPNNTYEYWTLDQLDL